MHRLFTALALAGLTSVATAAPTSIFGIELGQPLSLPECPFKPLLKSKMYDVTPASTCVEDAGPLNGYGVPVRRVVFSQAEAPPIVKNWTLFPLEQDGKVIGVHWITAGVDSQALVLEQLRAKFGAVTSQTAHQVQTAMGASFDAVTATWSLPGLSVRFYGVGDRITSGQVYVDLPEAAALRAEWERKEAAPQRKL